MNFFSTSREARYREGKNGKYRNRMKVLKKEAKRRSEAKLKRDKAAQQCAKRKNEERHMILQQKKKEKKKARRKSSYVPLSK